MQIGESGLDLQAYLEEAPTAWELVSKSFSYSLRIVDMGYVVPCVWICLRLWVFGRGTCVGAVPLGGPHGLGAVERAFMLFF